MALSDIHGIMMKNFTHSGNCVTYLSYMDIFAIPSLNDGCPNALLEAMLAEKAVVGTNVDAIGEIIEDGVNGLLVNSYSSHDLEIAIAKLIDAPLLRQTLGQAAKQKVVRDLNPAVEQANWAKVYDRVLTSKNLPELKVVTAS